MTGRSKQPKTPPLAENTKLLCFDLETNGLHGEAFAVGAVVMGVDGKIYDEFTGRCAVIGNVDSWVEQNVLPAIADMPISHASYKDLREDFWKWYLLAEPKSDYVLVSNGYPVEYRFLLKCQEENIEERYWQHPFPILDLASLLLQAGIEPTDRNKLIGRIIESGGYSRHHPLHDAKVSALAAYESFRLTGRI